MTEEQVEECVEPYEVEEQKPCPDAVLECPLKRESKGVCGDQ